MIDDKAESILEATYNYGYTYIYKDTGYNTDSLTSYSGKLHTLNKEKIAALQTIDKQKQEISDLKKKQKNYKLVIWLYRVINDPIFPNSYKDSILDFAGIDLSAAECRGELFGYCPWLYRQRGILGLCLGGYTKGFCPCHQEYGADKRGNGRGY